MLDGRLGAPEVNWGQECGYRAATVDLRRGTVDYGYVARVEVQSEDCVWGAWTSSSRKRGFGHAEALSVSVLRFKHRHRVADSALASLVVIGLIGIKSSMVCVQ